LKVSMDESAFGNNEVLVALHDIYGKMIFSKVVSMDETKGNIVLDPSGAINPGVYFVVGSDDTNLYKQRIVVSSR